MKTTNWKQIGLYIVLVLTGTYGFIEAVLPGLQILSPNLYGYAVIAIGALSFFLHKGAVDIAIGQAKRGEIE